MTTIVSQQQNQSKTMKETENFFTQCELRAGKRITIGWIPTEEAKKGNQVRLLTLLEGKERWKVTEVYGPKRPMDDVLEDERHFKDFQGSLKGGGINEGKGRGERGGGKSGRESQKKQYAT